MRISRSIFISGWLAVCSLQAENAIDFEQKVLPIFTEHCVSCHGPEKQKSGLRLDSFAALQTGADSGSVVQPGKPDASRLFLVIAGGDPETIMPPKGESLNSEQVGIIRQWIEQGAPAGTASATSVSAPTKSTHWSLQPISKPVLPRLKESLVTRSSNPIDLFIFARLAQENLSPSPEADQITLLRRLSFDLTGLPPEPAEVAEFLNDRRPDAYGRLVDRLLASPHFGERWGKHWLDAARYADTDGYAKDLDRPWAWRYRDWVIQALNSDLPFDQFTILQLAGDLLPGAGYYEKMATGFHRNTLVNRENGADPVESRVKELTDRVATTGTVWLGLTVGCAECHTHKYDPITQREFYQLYAFFNEAEDQSLDAPPSPHDPVAFRTAKESYNRQIGDLRSELGGIKYQILQSLPDLEANLRNPKGSPISVPENIQAVLSKESKTRTKEEQNVLVDFFTPMDERGKELLQDIAMLKPLEPKPGNPKAMVLGRPAKIPPTHIHKRGNFLDPGDNVEPATPAALPALSIRGKRPDRLDLARWLVSPENPLTARVTVNRVWLRLFGRGLVATDEDFGTQGDKPSHPELLDYLAAEFRGNGWSLKQLIRTIVMSSTYRQSSAIPPHLAQRDPKNILLARQNRLRLEAELVRDAGLAVSGRLNRQIGGPSFRPPLPSGASEIGFRLVWPVDNEEQLQRRSCYIFIKRSLVHPMLTTFDAPDTATTCTRRLPSNTPLQALTLLNDPSSVDNARALARRIEKVGATLKLNDRLSLAFQRAVSRQPDATEIQTLERLFQQFSGYYEQHPKEAVTLVGKANGTAASAAWVALGRVLLNLDEAITRE